MTLLVHPTALLAICDYAARYESKSFFGILWGNSETLEVVDSFELPEPPDLSFIEQKATLLATMRPTMNIAGWYHCSDNLDLTDIPKDRRDMLDSLTSNQVVLLLNPGREIAAFQASKPLAVKIRANEAEEAVIEDVIDSFPQLDPQSTLMPFALAAHHVSEYLEKTPNDIYVAAKAAKITSRLRRLPCTVKESSVIAELIGALVLSSTARTRNLASKKT